MRYEPTAIPDVFLLTPQVVTDERGFFMETWRENDFFAHVGPYRFVQENQSCSRQGVLRGLHFQEQKSQGKLVRCVTGEIFDVAVDLRPGSPSRGKWVGRFLSETNNCLLWIPPGFAHGFYTRSPEARLVYKCTEYYAPEYERTLLWNDPVLRIDWPLKQEPVLSPKDLQGCCLADLDPNLASGDKD